MSDPSPEEFVDAVANLIRDQLEQGASVDLPTLGTFSLEHHPSERTEEGVRTPPRNVITFTPADAASSDQ